MFGARKEFVSVRLAFVPPDNFRLLRRLITTKATEYTGGKDEGGGDDDDDGERNFFSRL